MARFRFAVRTCYFVGRCVLALSCYCLVARAAEPPAVKPTSAPPASPLKFDSTGAMPGEQLPDLTLRTLKDEPQRLADVWHSRPALLLASSFTCPKSRSRWPEAKAIAEKYKDKLNVVIVYVIEAHPSGDICPYKGVEDVTEENRRDGILRHQPKLLADRIELAEAFKSRMDVTVPIYVDTMDNLAWKSLGGGPNMGVLVQPGGAVEFRQGWFDGATMTKAIDECFAKLAQSEKNSAILDKKQSEILEQKLKAKGIEPYSLWSIFRAQDLSKARELLKELPELVKYVGPGFREPGISMLHEAATTSNLAMMQILLDGGSDVDLQSYGVNSVLHQAASKGDLKTVEWLVAHRANVHLRSAKGGVTPLDEAVLNVHPDMAQVLIKAGAKEDFFTDVGLGKLAAVASAVSVDPSRAFRPDRENRTPLQYAAANGQVDVAKVLLAADGAALDTGDRRKETALFYAVEHDQAAMTELLLTAGLPPDIHRGYYESDTPLHVAARNDSAEIIKILIAHKADIESREYRALTPLQVAAAEGKTKAVEALLQLKADPNAEQQHYSGGGCGPYGGYPATLDTPLHLALQRGQPEVVELLLAGGAKIDSVNALGNTPLMDAIPPTRLINAGLATAKYCPDSESDKLRRAEAIKCLLAHNADRTVKNNAGDTVVELARESKDPLILKALGIDPPPKP